MSHLDSDRLVLLALGERSADEAEAGHLDACPICRSEVDALRMVVAVGRDTEDLRALPPPPARVWQQIADQTMAAQAPPQPVAEAPRQPRVAEAPRQPRVAFRWPRWTRPLALGLATAAVAIAGTIGVTSALNQDRTQVEAQADLVALTGAPQGATGNAQVLDERGEGRLHLHVTGLPLRPGYYEVWLINPDTQKMISVGVLGGTDALLPLPSTVDLYAYRLVDISAEDYDGDTTHSGNSLLRGTLTR